MKRALLGLRAVAAIVLCAGLALGAHAATPEEDAAIGLIREQFKDVDLRSRRSVRNLISPMRSSIWP